jgi:putative addiction module CopG family antidote
MPEKKTIEVALTPRQRRFVSKRVAEGDFQSPQEVIRAGLNALEKQDNDFVEAVEEVRAKIAEGLADLRAGRKVDGRSAMARLRKKLSVKAQDRGR